MNLHLSTIAVLFHCPSLELLFHVQKLSLLFLFPVEAKQLSEMEPLTSQLRKLLVQMHLVMLPLDKDREVPVAQGLQDSHFVRFSWAWRTAVPLAQRDELFVQRPMVQRPVKA